MWLGHEQLHDAFDGSDDSALPAPIAPGKRTLTSRLPARASDDAASSGSNASPMSNAASSPSTSTPGPVIFRKALSSPLFVDPFDFHFTDAGTAHRADAGGGSAPEQVTALAQSGGAPLSESLRALFEPRFGQDFGDVRVHTGDEAASAARSIDARAYTLGSSIVFGAGQYQPDSRDGQHLLAHELTHVVQQRGSVQRAVYRAGGETSAASSAPGAAGPAARLTQAAEQLESLRAMAAALFAAQPEHAAAIEGMARGLAKLRALIASDDRAAQERALQELAQKLPPGLLTGLESNGPEVAAPGGEPPTEVPQIVEQRAPEIARAGLTVSRVSDPAEQEAERVADAVMSGGHAAINAFGAGSVQRGGGPGGNGGNGGGGDGGFFDGLAELIGVVFAVLLAFAVYAYQHRAAPQPHRPINRELERIKALQQKDKQEREKREKEKQGKEKDKQNKSNQKKNAKHHPSASSSKGSVGKAPSASPPKPKNKEPVREDSVSMEPSLSAAHDDAHQDPPSVDPTVAASLSTKPESPALEKPALEKPALETSAAKTQPDASKPDAPSKSDGSAPKPTTKAAPKDPPPSKITIDVAAYEGDPVSATEALDPGDDPTFLELAELMSTHPCTRVAAIYQICERKLPRTKQVLAATARFPGDAVVQFLDREAASPLAVEFLLSIRSDLTKATLKDWCANFERWSGETRKKLADDLSVEDDALDASLLSRYGGEATRWVGQLKVDVNVAADWIELTNKKGGLEARRFVAVHVTVPPAQDNRNQLFKFLEAQKEPLSASALTLAYHQQRKEQGQAAPEAALVQDEDDQRTGLGNNGTDCFLISACQLLALPAYDGVQLLPAVRAVVTKIQQGRFVSHAEVHQLRVYLHRLGLVDAIENRHEDASELLARLLESARGVRITEHHHIDESNDGAESDPRARPTLESRPQYDDQGDLAPKTLEAEAMLQVPIDAHASLEEWLNAAHTDGAEETLEPDPARPASYEWVSLGGQLQSVLSRTTRTHMHSLPTPLTIMLKRFNNYGRKVRKAFAMPETFEVTEQNLQTHINTRRTYQLKGIVYHQGSHGLGHYWMHRHDDQDGWVTAEDSRVREARQSLAPRERDLEHDINHGYLYTYVQTGSAVVPAWTESTGTAFDRDELGPPAALGGLGLGHGKRKASEQDGDKDEDESASTPKAGLESEVVRAQRWYGIGALEGNRDQPKSADTATLPAKGLINEGPCEQITQALVDGMAPAKLTDSKMVGAVKTLSGAWYVTCSGRPDPRFSQVVDYATEVTGLPLQLILTSSIAPVYPRRRRARTAEEERQAKKERKYIQGDDIRTFGGGKADPGNYYNHPKADDHGEIAGGAPGTCALPKLMDHLIAQQDPPVHASEKWFTTKPRSTVDVLIAADDEEAHSHKSGETVPSCKTCRSIVAQQLKGVDKVVASFLKNEKQRKEEIATRAARHAQNMHLYTELVMRQLPAFSKEISEINPEYFEPKTYGEFKRWYRAIVETMVAEHLDELVAAEDERYTEADLDEEIDLELGDHLGEQEPDDDEEEDVQIKEEAPVLDEQPLNSDEREKLNKKKRREDTAKKKKVKKAKNQAAAKEKGRKKPVVRVESDDESTVEEAPVAKPKKAKRALSAADKIFVRILNKLAAVNEHWSQIPEAAWAGPQQTGGIEFEMSGGLTQKKQAVDQAQDEMADIREALTELSNELSRED